ncbi:MAG: DUF6789 family protein [Oligoflexales bacterium]
MEITNIVLSGFVATSVMTTFIYLIHISKISNADMIGALGSYISSDLLKARLIGTLIHFSIGLSTAFFYVAVWSRFNFSQNLPGVGLLTGFAQGLVVSLGLVVLVAEHHPSERFRKVGFGIALTHLFAHIVYGGVLGTAASYLESTQNLLTSVGQYLYG